MFTIGTVKHACNTNMWRYHWDQSQQSASISPTQLTCKLRLCRQHRLYKIISPVQEKLQKYNPHGRRKDLEIFGGGWGWLCPALKFFRFSPNKFLSVYMSTMNVVKVPKMFPSIKCKKQNKCSLTSLSSSLSCLFPTVRGEQKNYSRDVNKAVIGLTVRCQYFKIKSTNPDLPSFCFSCATTALFEL